MAWSRQSVDRGELMTVQLRTPDDYIRNNEHMDMTPGSPCLLYKGGTYYSSLPFILPHKGALILSRIMEEIHRVQCLHGLVTHPSTLHVEYSTAVRVDMFF